jgi:hypothetical protein
MSSMSAGARFLRRKQAAEYISRIWGIPTSPRTLAKLAVIGGGPPFRKAGRWPLYEPADLDAWVERRLGPKQNSTSDNAASVAKAYPATDKFIEAGAR